MFARTLFAVALLSNVALAFRDARLDKVVTMLTELRDKTNSEQEAEAETYNKFACFCKDTMAQKNSDISDGGVANTDTLANLNQATSDRDAADTGVAEAVHAISGIEEEITTLKSERRAAVLDYEKSEVDLTAAIHALGNAIRTLKATKTAVGFLDIRPVADTVRTAIYMADALGLGSEKQRRNAAALLATGREDPVYDFKSDDVISTLEGLETDFKGRKETLDSDEVAATATYHQTLQAKEASITTNQDAIESHKRDKATATVTIATASQDITASSAQLLDNQEYLTELAKRCSAKATVWDQRTQIRADEIQALSQAITLLGSDEGSTSFVQFRRMSHHSRRYMKAHMRSAPSTRAITALTASKRSLRGNSVRVAVSSRDRAAQLLRAAAKQIRSAQLSRLAGQVAEDPLAKVKTLIQELVERLLKEAQEEANHKGWCDKEVALAEQERDQMAESIKEVNGQLSMSEARIEKVTAKLSSIEKELSELNSTLVEAEGLRTTEKEQNTQAVSDAQEAESTVAQAIDVLDKFYKTAANEASFLQSKNNTVEEDIPDAGFDSAYTGQQDGKNAVIGMLEVVKSDYARTIKQTQDAEAKAEADFQELSTSTQMSQAAKGEALTATEKALSDTNAADTENREKLGSDKERLVSSITQLLSLHKACFDGGDTPEERKAKREEELSALKSALCILDAHGTDGADSC